MTDRHELERLLREPVERLTPPDGMWDQIEKRARRRKWMSASASAAAVLIIAAGAVPAVIAVRHNANNQTLSLNGNFADGTTSTPTATTTSQPAPARLGPLAGYVPESLSFIGPDTGFLWGSAGTSRAGIVAKTTNGGKTWVKLSAPAVKDEYVADQGALQIRFANTDVGFLYGSKNLITTDGGVTWRHYAAPGYIADLESVQQRIWALIRPSAKSTAVRLYSATPAHPQLVRVHGVPVMHGLPGTAQIAGAASIALSGSRVDVVVGSSSFYSSANGKHFVPRANPCPAKVGGTRTQTALLTSTDTLGVAVACGYAVHSRSQTKRLYASPDSGNGWQKLATQPTSFGLLQTFAAGSTSDLVIGTTWGGAEITHDGGTSWAATVPAPGELLSFVGFINVDHIVGVADRASSGTGAFATSFNSGNDWTVTPFAAAS